MQLKEFLLVSLLMESGEVLKAIETAIPTEAIEQVLGQTDSREIRKRKLRSHLAICMVIAMSIWSSDSMRT
ncbi:MAG: transposase domain-containing protein, partial [Nostoc sp.]|uniref:transposase domain-containing protein n=1 Tax=Nostoc sp. TaxID=1180 RepID=UPI002FF5952E